MTAAKRKTRTYSETERLGIMTVALRDGIAKASKASKAPQRTIYTWFDEAGGLAEIRTFAATAADRSLSVAEQAVCDEVARRVSLVTEVETDRVTDPELMLTFRALVVARASATANAAAGAAAGAEAGAQASASVINVTVNEK